MKGMYGKIDKFLEMPKEICSNVPKIYITGFEEILIQNIKGILEYDEVYVSISSYIGVINISGIELKLENMSNESVKIKGGVESIEFEKLE